jgi:hypothetical protein
MKKKQQGKKGLISLSPSRGCCCGGIPILSTTTTPNSPSTAIRAIIAKVVS